MLKLICLVLVAMATKFHSVECTAEALSHATAHFGRSLEECREESGLSADIMESFHKFWSEDFDVVHREVGCAIICMSNKFQLMHDDANMHHGNMMDYIRSFPDGDKLAEMMVKMIHECEKNYQDLTDRCMMVTKTAACFKQIAKNAGIAPELAMIEAVMEHYT